MKFRSSSHNTTHVTGDKIKVIKEFKVNDSVLTEKNIHTKLGGLLLEGEKEFFMCPYNLLESIVDVIVRNDDQENELVNKIIDIVYSLKKNKFNCEDWMRGLPSDIFKETLRLTQGEERIAEFDVSKWAPEQKKEFVKKCVEEYAKQNDKIIWKPFQTFLSNALKTNFQYKFKALDWRPLVKETAQKENLTFQLRA